MDPLSRPKWQKPEHLPRLVSPGSPASGALGTEVVEADGVAAFPGQSTNSPRYCRHPRTTLKSPTPLRILLCVRVRVVSELDKKWVKRQQAYQRRKTLREQAVAYKGGKCVICGYTGFPSAFDFHHFDPRTKDFTISKRVVAFETIRPELDKCVLVCCRCHREIHDGLHPGYLVRDDDDRGGWDGYDPDEEDPNELTYEEELEVNEVLASVS